VLRKNRQNKIFIRNVFFTNKLNVTTFRKKQIVKFVAGKKKFRVLNLGSTESNFQFLRISHAEQNRFCF